MLTPEQAWGRIEPHLAVLGPETVARDAALGRVLSATLSAGVDQPQADVSAMDGYALAGEVEAGAALPVVGTAAAGAPPEFSLAAGEAAKIMTGAVVPRGADRVLQVEHTDGGGERVTVERCPFPGEHIRRQGEVVRRGDDLLAAGSLVGPGAVSLLAAHGIAEVEVPRRPRVAVVVTGDELVPAGEEPGPGRLRDSNSSFLLAAGRVLGLDFEHLGIAGDRLDDLRRSIARGLQADVLLLTGGVSMGEYDLVEDVLSELGCTALFDRVAIQPGKPLVAARHPGGWAFGLPGNPASVMCTFWLFVAPLLRRLQSQPGAFWRGALTARLTAPLPASPLRDRFLSATLDPRAGQLLATPHLPAGSHDVIAYARGSALLRIRRGAEPAAAGERCEVLPLSGL